MENLVYIHLASSYEGNEDIEYDAASEDVKVFLKVNWRNVYKRAWIHLLSLVLTIGSVGIATQAMAQMSQGSTGQEVAELQKKLQKLGYFDRRPTGHFGPLTKAAVIRFQKDEGLTANGTVETETQAALERRGNSETQTQAASQSPTEVSEKPIDLSKVPTLRRGSKGTDVKSLQKLLTDAGAYSAEINGVFDLQTSIAVRQFQRSNRLFVDGVAGRQTWAALAKGKTQAADPTFNNSPFTDEPLTSGSNQEQGSGERVSRSNLRQGDNGSGVRTLQERLLALGYYKGNTTGNFGPLTKEAVIRFQKDSGLTANGVVDRSTLAALVTPPKVRNFSVTQLQKQLKEKGFYQGPIDGVYNDDTKAAIKAAQRAYGVSENDLFRDR